MIIGQWWECLVHSVTAACWRLMRQLFFLLYCDVPVPDVYRNISFVYMRSHWDGLELIMTVGYFFFSPLLWSIRYGRSKGTICAFIWLCTSYIFLYAVKYRVVLYTAARVGFRCTTIAGQIKGLKPCDHTLGLIFKQGYSGRTLAINAKLHKRIFVRSFVGPSSGSVIVVVYSVVDILND